MANAIRLLSDDYGFDSFIKFTTKGRFLMSGNVRAWRDLFKNMMEWIGIPACFESFIKANPVLFPEYQDELFNKSLNGFIRPIGAEDLATELEFMVHCRPTVKFVVDRGITHEIVRHRTASFAQESTRYCNYGKEKFGGEITCIIPEFFEEGSPEWNTWKNLMEWCEADYLNLLKMGVTPEKARAVLPHSLKTELIMTASCAEWHHFFNLRACNSTGKAHPQILEVARPLLDDFKNTFRGVFDDLNYE